MTTVEDPRPEEQPQAAGGEETVFDEPFLHIGYRKAGELLVLRWRGYAPSADYRRGLDFALDFALGQGVKRWLADLRHMGPILQADERWTNQTWFPQLASGELERMAILRSNDYFNQQSVDRIMQRSMDVVDFEVGWFGDEQEAMRWLFAGVRKPK
jgi:hypothetical protein